MNKQRAFTLVELLVTLAIAAIVLSVGVPSFRDFIMNNRIISQANQFHTDMNVARSTAIKYQRNTQICVSTDYTNAAPSCTGGTDWSAGWIVWVDKNRDAAIDAPGEIIRRGDAFDGTTTFTSTARTSFTYDSRGFVNATDTLTLCDDRAAEIGRIIDIRDVGRINISQTNCP